MRINWPDGLDEARFLADYWQQKPLLIRAAFPEFENPVDPNELAGLACDEDANARYIEHTGNNEWRLCPGPLSDDFFDDVTGNQWSLLVSDVEKLLPDFKSYLQPFRFLPDWRIDDLMISYAPVGGSVGAHVDLYDVFLLQADGTREWQIENTARHDTSASVSSTIALLGDFSADDTWHLNAGDMLYLPPKFAHHGIAAAEPCMTWSIGFRAPSVDEMLPEVVNYLLEDQDVSARFTDPGRTATDSPGLLNKQDVAQLAHLLKTALEHSDETLHQWVGRYVTSPKEVNDDDEQTVQITQDAMQSHLNAGGTLNVNSQKRTAYTTSDSGTTLFSDGRSYPCTAKLAQMICDKLCVSKADNLDSQSIELLRLLCEQQILLMHDANRVD